MDRGPSEFIRLELFLSDLISGCSSCEILHTTRIPLVSARAAGGAKCHFGHERNGKGRAGMTLAPPAIHVSSNGLSNIV